MVRRRFGSMALAATLLASLPAVAVAAEDPTSPEGVDWALTSYLVRSEFVDVPMGIDATLLLEDGTASGSGGCNRFTGSYVLDGPALEFDAALSRTLMACDGEADDVEDAYLSSLLDVAGWDMSGGVLELSDDSGEVILTFAVPGESLTSRDLAVLLARLDTTEADMTALRERLDTLSDRLRSRIRALEADNKELKRQVAELRRRPTPTPAPVVQFNAAERMLLEGVPSRIAGRCKPLRSRLPAGTVAAVECLPNTSIVSEMAYYLMDSDEAIALYDSKMRGQGLEPLPDVAPEGMTGCWEGAPSYDYAPGGYIGGVGCYVEDGEANLRIIQEATDCKQMRVGDTQLERPVMYVALASPNRNITRLYDWAMRNKPAHLISGLVEPIPRPDARRSPTCGS